MVGRRRMTTGASRARPTLVTTRPASSTRCDGRRRAAHTDCGQAVGPVPVRPIDVRPAHHPACRCMPATVPVDRHRCAHGRCPPPARCPSTASGSVDGARSRRAPHRRLTVRDAPRGPITPQPVPHSPRPHVCGRVRPRPAHQRPSTEYSSARRWFGPALRLAGVPTVAPRAMSPRVDAPPRRDVVCPARRNDVPVTTMSVTRGASADRGIARPGVGPFVPRETTP